MTDDLQRVGGPHGIRGHNPGHFASRPEAIESPVSLDPTGDKMISQALTADNLGIDVNDYFDLLGRGLTHEQAIAVAGVPSTHPRVQAGEVFDAVKVVEEGSGFKDSRIYYRRRPGVTGGIPWKMRVQANRRISWSETENLAQLIGYAAQVYIRGRGLGEPEQDTPYSFVITVNMERTGRSDLGVGIAEFEESLPETIRDGSPVRKTDRSGAGTKGTRLVQGMGDDISVELYYDDVISEELEANLSTTWADEGKTDIKFWRDHDQSDDS